MREHCTEGLAGPLAAVKQSFKFAGLFGGVRVCTNASVSAFDILHAPEASACTFALAAFHATEINALAGRRAAFVEFAEGVDVWASTRYIRHPKWSKKNASPLAFTIVPRVKWAKWQQFRFRCRKKTT